MKTDRVVKRVESVLFPVPRAKVAMRTTPLTQTFERMPLFAVFKPNRPFW